MLDDKFFVSPTVIAKNVTLPDGSVHQLHFKQVPHTEFRRYKLAEESADENRRVQCVAQLISASLCTDQGEPVLSVEKAASLNPAGANALMSAVIEVNSASEQAGNA